MKGSQPVVKYEHKRRDKHCVMGALSSGHFIYELSDKLNSDIFKNFLIRLIDQFKKVVIVIDHGPYHVSKNMQQFYAEYIILISNLKKPKIYDGNNICRFVGHLSVTKSIMLCELPTKRQKRQDFLSKKFFKNFMFLIF